jgi:hypothetical protein
MTEGKRLLDRGPVMFVALAIAVLLIALAIVEALGGQARAADDRPWAEYLKSMEGALAAGDAKTADWALRQAHWVALGSRRWEGMIEVGDAARRAGNITVARTAYLTAAFRARRVSSFAGILSAAEAFAVLGDVAIAEQWLQVGRGLAAPDESALARMQAVAESVNKRGFASDIEP